MMNTGEHQTIVMPQARRSVDAAAAGPSPGARLGKYRLCIPLASGGMSTVYLARVQDGVGHNRFVALKCLKPKLADEPVYVEMFLDEARISSMIHHPNVCDVIDFRVQGGISYMVMELLEGQSLAAILQESATPPEAWPPARIAGVIARVVADAAEGLHAAHELTDAHGNALHVVHRDISPENVFVTYDGNVKVMDFGVALTSQQRHHTDPGTFKGKYSYIAPEVLRGGKPDRRSDVWGLGMLAWELLVGRRLFAVENDVQVLRAVLDMEIPLPSQARPGVPPSFDETVLRALDRDPAHRFQTARELGRKLICLLVEERMAIGLAEIADFMAQLFPNGRACAHQLRDTVERMDDGAVAEDNDHPTVASPLSDPARVLLTPRLPPMPPPARPQRDDAHRRWLWSVAPPLTALAIVAVDFAVRTRMPAAEPEPPPAPVAQARRAPVATPAPASCVPDAITPTPALWTPGSAAPLQVELQPMQLPTGEVVFRIRAPAGAPQ